MFVREVGVGAIAFEALVRFVTWATVLTLKTGLAGAQESPSKREPAAREGFRATAFPAGSTASFRRAQAGAEIVNLEDAGRILPDRIQDQTTYSLLLRDGTNVAVYFGRNTTCILSAKAR